MMNPIRTSDGKNKGGKSVWNEKGYTLVETLVAFAILTGVLIPATLFLGKVTASRKAIDTIQAFQLAEAEMERTIGFELYEDDRYSIELNHGCWWIERSVWNRWGIVDIRVKVFKNRQVFELIELKTLRVFE